MKRILLSIITLLTIFSSVAYSYDVHRLDNVNIEEVKIKAQQGDAEAQCTLGFCLLGSKYAEKDMQKALEWLHKSAEQECSDAQVFLGLFYYIDKNKDVKQRREEGKYWLRRAANNGCKSAKAWLYYCEEHEKMEYAHEQMIDY